MASMQMLFIFCQKYSVYYINGNTSEMYLQVYSLIRLYYIEMVCSFFLLRNLCVHTMNRFIVNMNVEVGLHVG